MSTINFMEDYKEGITLLDITPGLLMKMEKFKLEKDIKPTTISAYYRHLRAIINFYMYELKTTPPIRKGRIFNKKTSEFKAGYVREGNSIDN